ncbi:MAG: rhodanese-like domain-containing protein [Lentisphaerales bacterium]|nr:rhodanese-like domain-containing protein [Lentisphaerales bacterium]
MKQSIKVISLFFTLPLIPALFLQSHIKEYVYKGDLVAEQYSITVEKSKGLQNILWLDSRKKSKYKAGKIEGAIWVSFKDWEGSLMKIFESFEPGQNIIVYCNPACTTSRNLAKQLRQEMGQENIFYLEGGYEAWLKLQK